GKNRLAGNYVRVNHGDGWVTSYAHLSRVLVKVGMHLKAGSKIGLIGKTGDADGYHLHFAVKIHGRSIDPMQILPNMSKG
ncbi:MAG: M23 family metallopeptidase, partial [Mariprofundales bacterium]